jgi:hypothetical protein
LIGGEIVEEEQKGRKRAGYGEMLLQNLSQRLTSEFGAGYSVQNVKFIRQFYLEYPGLMSSRDIGYALRSQSAIGLLPAGMQIRHAVSLNTRLQIAYDPQGFGWSFSNGVI